jgi:hypothetical protein
MDISPEVLERYIAYKKRVLSYYSTLLREHELTSIKVLIEALRGMDSLHTEHIISNKSMICPPCADFSTPLALTPLDEYKQVSRVFNDIISFKERAIEEHFADVKEEVVGLIKATEEDMHSQLKLQKVKYHL